VELLVTDAVVEEDLVTGGRAGLVDLAVRRLRHDLARRRVGLLRDVRVVEVRSIGARREEGEDGDRNECELFHCSPCGGPLGTPPSVSGGLVRVMHSSLQSKTWARLQSYLQKPSDF